MSNFAMSCTRRLLAEACLIGAALFIALTAQTASAQWGIVNLHPSNPTVFDSYLTGVRDGQQVGYIRTPLGRPTSRRRALPLPLRAMES